MTEKPLTRQLPHALFVDDDIDFLEGVSTTMKARGICHPVCLSDSSRVLAELENGHYSALFLDQIMPHVTGSDLLPVVVNRFPELPVIMMTGISDIETVVDCMKQGAMDYLTKPVDAVRLCATLTNAFRLGELSSRNRQLQNYLQGTPLARPGAFSQIITRTEAMQSLCKLAESMAASTLPVLITGETGTGKELFARAIHTASGLSGEFVPLNVAGLDSLMFDDTLYGHRKGAFTGAMETREGLIAKARGGTIFLDEIGDLAPESQSKMLRLLQENEYYRLGSDLLMKSEARVIAATNCNLLELVREGRFREDLYYRLRGHRIHVPPLRERRGDIILLAENYADREAKRFGRAAPAFAAEVTMLLEAADYPGNVRELVTMVGCAVAANKSGLLTRNDFPELRMGDQKQQAPLQQLGNGQYALHALFPTFPTMEQIEHLMLDEALKSTGGNKSAAADLLGIARQTVLRKLNDRG